MSTSRGNTWLYDGIKSTSSNVRPSPKNFWDLLFEGARPDNPVGRVFIVAMCKDRRAEEYGQNFVAGQGVK